jgi:pyrroloquinoline quinone (PQQ) biosynthesis protein C
MAKLTPKQALMAMRLVDQSGLVQKYDSDDTRSFLQGLANSYLQEKAAGRLPVDEEGKVQSFNDWMDTADMEVLAGDEEEDEAEVDPQ